MPSPTTARGLPLTSALHPRPSDLRHLCPYGRYWQTGTGEGACRAGMVDIGAQRTAGVGVVEHGGGT